MNRNILSMILSVAVGAGIGSAVTYKIMKAKHDQIIQEEIDSLRVSFSGIHKKKKESEDSSIFTEKEVNDNKKIINKNEYITESEDTREDVGNMSDISEPYVISPDQFGDCDYISVSLWYYADGVVTNDDGKVIANVEELVGDDFADHFGEYEEDPDTVYVRNDDQGIDYQVLADLRSYSDYSNM